MNWPRQLLKSVEDGDRAVLVTVAWVEGSAPREAGTKMIVSNDCVVGTIGGGQLEYQVLSEARGMLAGDMRGSALQTFPLGPQLGQCCGGSTKIAFETFGAEDRAWIKPLLAVSCDTPVHCLRSLSGPAERWTFGDLASSEVPPALQQLVAPHLGGENLPALLLDEEGQSFLLESERDLRRELVLFGAGHVGQALMRALHPLGFKILWVDSREDAFPASLCEGAETLQIDPPHYAVSRVNEGAFYLVMTHSHALDFDICEAVLRRGDAAYLGLIGSKTKRARFEKRLKARGFGHDDLEFLTCPIGLAAIPGKEPAVIAASVAADLLQRRTLLEASP